MPTFGRDEELQWLRTHALEGRAVLVTGAAGGGRTHLPGALAEQLARAGAPVGRISGGDGASAVPFAPFAPLVVEHLPHPAGQQVPDLEVFGRLPGRLVATGHVLVIDDLHLLDTASQILVAHLARAGLTLVASAPGRGTLPSALRDEVDGATGRRWSILALESLTDDSVLALAAEEAGDELAAPAGAFVVTHAEGNPRVATELVRGCEVRLTSYGAELGDLEVSPTSWSTRVSSRSGTRPGARWTCWPPPGGRPGTSGGARRSTSSRRPGWSRSTTPPCVLRTCWSPGCAGRD